MKLALALSLVVVGTGRTQVLVRVGDPHRTNYSELHEALREGTPAADSVRAVMGERRGGYDFLANDSSAVISRTGKWLTDRVRELEGRGGT
jgi:hypothetical protein